ncbi:MAG: YbaK/EbsC family protein [Nanoarchaeota archaeon]
METFKQIIELLDTHHISYEHLKHDFVHRSEEAAQVRRSSFEEAAKALVCQADGQIIMAVVPGPVKMSYNILKKEIGAKKMCLASPEEVLSATGLTIGSVPPFGIFWNIPMYVEKSLLAQEYMVFSAGSHYDSIRLKVEDYLKVVPAKVLEFRKE